MRVRQRQRFIASLVLSLLLGGALASNGLTSTFSAVVKNPSQESVPDYPQDISRVYVRQADNKLEPLPFEALNISFPIDAAAAGDKTGYAQLKGAHASSALNDTQPTFYVFVPEEMNPPPHLLIRLKSASGQRRLTAFAVKGHAGYIPSTTESVKLQYRTLERVPVQAGPNVIYVLFVELKPRGPLASGEYAFIGNDPKMTATFSVGSTAQSRHP